MTSQVLDVSEQVSVTPLMTIDTVWPFSAPDVVTVTVPSLLSSTALRWVPHAAETDWMVGWVLSTVTAELSVTADTAVPALPAESVNAIENATAPSVSASATSATQVHVFPAVLVVVMELSAIAAPPEVKVHVGEPIASDAVNVRVMSSPLFALPALFTAIPTTDRVGCVLSIVTAPEVALVIAVAIALPAKSEYVQENPTAPS